MPEERVTVVEMLDILQVRSPKRVSSQHRNIADYRLAIDFTKKLISR